MGNSQKRKLSKKRGGAGELQQENAPQVDAQQINVNVEQPPQVNVEQPPEVKAPEVKMDAARPANCPPCPVGEEAPPPLSKAQQAEDIVKGAHASVLNAITGNAASLKDKVTGTGQGLVAKLNTLVGNDETKAAAAPVAGGGRRRTRKRSRRGKKSRKSRKNKRKTSKRSRKNKRSKKSKRRY